MIGAVSSQQSGAAAGRAGRSAALHYNQRTGESRDMLGGLAFGNPYLQGRDGYIDPQYRSSIQGLLQSQGIGHGGVIGAQGRLADQQARQGRGVVRSYNRDTRALAQQGSAQAGNVGGAYSQLGLMADQWGRGREDIINQDADKQHNAMDQTSLARLAASGFGNSTAATAQLSANARNVGEQRQRSLQDLAEAQIQHRLGVGMAGAGAQERIGEANLGRAQNRAQTVPLLRNQNINRNYAARNAPLNTALQVAQGSTFNPWLGQNTTGFYPGASASGAALGTAASGLGALGGYYMGQRGAGGPAPGAPGNPYINPDDAGPYG